MELVSALRGVSDSLRASAAQLEEELEAVHARMTGELEGAGPDEPERESSEREPRSTAPGPDATAPVPVPEATAELDVPDFVQHR
jgi:hypothetical protein